MNMIDKKILSHNLPSSPSHFGYWRAGNFQFSKKTGNASGFTLIEMLVYVALVALLISAIVFFGLWAIQVGTKTKVNAETLNNARRAMEIMVYEIKKSTGVYAPTSSFDAHPGQLSLEQANPAGSEETSGFVDFFICGQALCLKREKAAAIALTSNSVRVTNLVFNRRLNSQGSPSIRLSISVASLSSDRPESTASVDLTTAANLRSY